VDRTVAAAVVLFVAETLGEYSGRVPFFCVLHLRDSVGTASHGLVTAFAFPDTNGRAFDSVLMMTRRVNLLLVVDSNVMEFFFLPCHKRYMCTLNVG
jgi:hypothetical protein